MTIQILHVEDSEADAELVADAFKFLNVDASITWAENGNRALAMLLGQGQHAARQRPDLVLLDLNMPIKSGRDVLAALKCDDSLRSVPVIVLTTSRADNDIQDCYELGANAYLMKPGDLQGLRKLVAAIQAFWVDANVF